MAMARIVPRLPSARCLRAPPAWSPPSPAPPADPALVLSTRAGSQHPALESGLWADWCLASSQISSAFLPRPWLWPLPVSASPPARSISLVSVGRGIARASAERIAPDP
eukprot:820393-Rhodomonas_salina.1